MVMTNDHVQSDKNCFNGDRRILTATTDCYTVSYQVPGLREAKGKANDVDDENDGNGKPVNEDHVLVIRTAST